MGQITHQKTYSKIYRTWIAMLSRCRNSNDPNYKNYGGRGIYVCESWNKFEHFFKDMGELPFYEAQIDRVDNEKGYFKENCRWVTCKQNSRNRRTTKIHKTSLGSLVQVELIEKIGWTKNQFRWFQKRYGISWILENFKNDTLPKRTNYEIDRKDLEGKNISNWKVIKFESYTKKTGHLYLCECMCGKQKLIPRNNLMRNKTHQCRSCSAKIFWQKRKSNCPLRGASKCTNVVPTYLYFP
jgi:hypothetical protein